jgi:uncharacterized protein (DUF58 family)
MTASPFTPQFYKRLQQLKIHTRKAFLGSRQGSHMSIRKGHGLEFHDYRPYSPGDDFRHIDWGVYGRSDRLYVRQFREEQDLNVAVLLDGSQSMAYPKDSGKFELAKNIALALGYVALTDGDAVTFSLLGKGNSPRFSGARSIARAVRSFEDAAPDGAIDLLTEVRAAVARLRMPGRCFLISDFLSDTASIISTLNFLRSRNFEISVLHILAPSELRLDLQGSIRVTDAESGEEIELNLNAESIKEYAIKLSEHVATLENFCHSTGIHHVLLSSDEQVSDIVLSKLPSVGILK